MLANMPSKKRKTNATAPANKRRKSDPNRHLDDDKDIWIVGNSMPYWAGRRAIDRHRPNLSLGTTIAWWGNRGMSWDNFTYSLQVDITLRQPPSVKAVHLGDNDMVSTRVEVLCSQIKEGLQSLRSAFPDTSIIWIDTLPRLSWGHPDAESDSIDRKWKRVNRWGRQQVHRLPKGRSPKIDIDRATTGFFRPDGIHLSDVGLEIYLDWLRDCLLNVIAE